MGHRYKFKKGNIPWNKGKSGYKLPPFSDKHKRKISENHSRHNLNKKMSEETKNKISKRNILMDNIESGCFLLKIEMVGNVDYLMMIVAVGWNHIIFLTGLNTQN